MKFLRRERKELEFDDREYLKIAAVLVVRDPALLSPENEQSLWAQVDDELSYEHDVQYNRFLTVEEERKEAARMSRMSEIPF